MLRNVIGFAVLTTIFLHGCASYSAPGGSGDPSLMDTCSPSHVPSAGTCRECSFRGDTFVLCNNTYVLCTTAKCEPSLTDASSAYCWCDVETGLSMRLTDVDAPGLISNFSYAQSPLRFIDCENANYIDCLGAPCRAIGDKAKCECKLTPNAGQFMLVGCSESTDCSMHLPFLSGVQQTPSALNMADALIQAMGHPPAECSP